MVELTERGRTFIIWPTNGIDVACSSGITLDGPLCELTTIQCDVRDTPIISQGFLTLVFALMVHKDDKNILLILAYLD